MQDDFLVNTVVVNSDDVAKEGVREVYATIRSDYKTDKQDNRTVDREWSFQLRGIGFKNPQVRTGFATYEEAQAAAVQAYEQSKQPQLSSKSKPVSSFNNLNGGVKSRRIFGQIITLMKAYYLIKPLSSPTRQRGFFAGTGDPSRSTTSGAINWWITERGIKTLEGIVDLAMSSDKALAGGDRDSFCEAIEGMLQNNAFNEGLFNSDHFILRDVENLFEARSITDKNEFAYLLWNKMHEAMSDELTTWLVVYPLFRVRSQSINLDVAGLVLISPDDTDLWWQITSQYSNAARWNPALEWPPDLLGKPVEKELPTWVVCEVKGTRTGAQQLAARRIRTFIAVLFAHLHPHQRSLLTKSAAAEFNYSQQFAINDSRSTCSQGSSFIGHLLPPLITDIQVTPEVIVDNGSDRIRRR